MPKRVVTAKFIEDTTSYTTDWGAKVTTSGLFNAPPDLTEANINAIVGLIGATRIGDLPPCNEAGGSLRKLRFIRRSGNTMTTPVASRAILLSAAKGIKEILDSANSASNPVVCIELIGEEYDNLNDEFSISYTAGTFAKTHRAPDNATKQYVYAGTVEYSSDSTNPLNGIIFQPVKAISDNENAPATQLDASWKSCVGEFVDVVPCPRNGRRNPFRHRRFTVTFLTKSQAVADPANPPAGIEGDAAAEQIEIPVANGKEADILACGQALAKLTGAYCIAYKGESYKRFHKIVA